jgi:hypothetical protein
MGKKSVLKIFDADPGHGMEKIRVWDAKKFGSATLVLRYSKYHTKKVVGTLLFSQVGSLSTIQLHQNGKPCPGSA